MEARIPFAGFYESMWSKGVDNAEEQYFEYLQEEHELHPADMPLLYDWMMRHAHYKQSYDYIAVEYVSPFQDFINENLQLDITLCYHDMTSPKYYNFETDKIFVGISYRDALRLARRVGRDALRKAAKQMFTSRDGFISHYRSDITEWGKLRTWDHNQLYCLFEAAVDVIGDDDYEWPIYEAYSENGDFDTAFRKAFEESELLLEIGKLIGAREKAEELEAELEENSDGKTLSNGRRELHHQAVR